MSRRQIHIDPEIVLSFSVRFSSILSVTQRYRVNVTVTDVDELRKELVVSLSKEEVSQEETAILKEFRKHARVPGFRPGKAPDQMIRQRFKGPLKEELSKKVVSKAFQDAVKEKNLEVYTVVQMSGEENIEPGQDVTLDITVDLNPTFDIPVYEGLDTSAPATEVEDSEIDEAVENIRRQRADFSVVERAAEKSDYVKLSYKGTADGTPVSEILPDEARLKAWGEITNGWEEAGTDEAKEFGVPEVIDGILGMSAGETKEITVDFADDFKIEALHGKSVVYAIEVHEVRQRVLPELNEEFFKSQNVESLEELKSNLFDQIEQHKKQQQRERQRNQVVEQLVNAVQFPIPQGAIEQETQSVMARIMMENMQRGVEEAEFEKHKEELHTQASQIAARDVKLRFILAKIAEKEEIKVENEDMQRAIMNAAMRQRRPIDEVVQELKKDSGRIRHLQQQLLIGKTLDLVVEKAKLSIVDAEEDHDHHDHDHGAHGHSH